MNKNQHKQESDERDDDNAVAVDAASSNDDKASARTGSDQVDDVEHLRKRIAVLEDSLLRAKADYSNLQRRTSVEQSEAIRYANADLMKSLLTVVDGLQNSIKASETSNNLASVFAGVKLIYEDFMKALSSQGLEAIEAARQKFDPAIHQALMQQPSNEVPAGNVIEQVARGYRLRDRVLRPARVVVSKGADTASGDGEAG